ncbi:MAG: DUF2520 domain-containing protein [Chloroflexi bacterium]|nr:DUF2520 domain-containing protein [Chloroflexota bacterium]
MTRAHQTLIGFVGAGTVGTALAVALARRGYRVVAVASRSPASARRLAARLPGCRAVTSEETARAVGLLFLTVPDDAISEVATALPWRPGQMAVHCSGAAPLVALAAARATGACVGAFHPLQTFADADQAAMALMAGITFVVEAEEPLRSLLHRMAADLGGRAMDLRPEDRTLYHVSGVLASNYLVALVAEAAGLWERFGVSRSEALAALLPLVRGTVENIEGQGLPRALTGPIARGDRGTIATHLAALLERAPDLVPLYREMARRTVPLAVEKGRMAREEATAILALVEGDPVREGR